MKEELSLENQIGSSEDTAMPVKLEIDVVKDIVLEFNGGYVPGESELFDLYYSAKEIVSKVCMQALSEHQEAIVAYLESKHAIKASPDILNVRANRLGDRYARWQRLKFKNHHLMGGPYAPNISILRFYKSGLDFL
tara:strand:- start:1028 stop:1435 length:408 start_codon:yes stop_codon:yes gene_type:complete